MSNIPKKRPVIRRNGASLWAKTKETEISIRVESIHRLQWGGVIALSGENVKYLLWHHNVTIYGTKEIFSDELLNIMMGKIVRVKMLLLSDTQWANGLDASELIGNAQSIVIIKDPDEFE
jgi:hypothetical protein